MGILGKLLPVAGAAVGGLVGGPAGAQIGASLGSAAGGALTKSGASKAATKAQLQAIEDAKKAAGGAYDDIKGYLQPGLDTYQPGVNALTGRLGLQTGATPPIAPSNNNTDPNFGAIRDNPYIRTGGPDDGSVTMDPAKAAARDAGTMGSRDGVIDMAPGPDGVYTSAPASKNALTASPGTYGNTDNPAFNETYATPAAPAPFNAPDAYSTPDAPGAFSYTLNDYVASPGYQYRQDQARKQVLASAGATGSRQSGASLKELYDRGDQIAYQDFGDERAFAYGLNRDQVSDYRDSRDFGYRVYGDNYDRSYGRYRDDVGDYRDSRDFGYSAYRDRRRDYEDQRNYLTGRFDRGTDDLFRYTGIGERAAGAASSAASRYGDQMINLAIGAGDARASNALTQGGIGSDLIGDIGGTLAGVYGGSSLDSRSGSGGGYTSDVGTVNYGNSLRLPRMY